MRRSDNAVEVGPDTPIRTRASVIIVIIVAVASTVATGFGFKSWMSSQFKAQQDKLEMLDVGQSNILVAVKRCWSIEDQQNWRDEELELNPATKLPRPNDIVRKRSVVSIP
jgi:beta-lactamase superfamily II metal-dependent hydrolase